MLTKVMVKFYQKNQALRQLVLLESNINFNCCLTTRSNRHLRVTSGSGAIWRASQSLRSLRGARQILFASIRFAHGLRMPARLVIPSLASLHPQMRLSAAFCRLAPRFRLANSFVLILRGARAAIILAC